MSRTLNTQPQQKNQWQMFDSQLKPPFLREDPPALPPSQQDIQECKQLYQKLINSQHQISVKIQNMEQKVSENNYQSGIGYYNAKNLLFMEYLIQLQFYQLFKINASDLTSGQGLQLYKRLVYLKTLLTKLAPVEKKLQYQKNKMLKYGEVLNVKVSTKAKETTQSADNQFQQNQDEENEESDQNEQQINEQEDQEDAMAYQPRLNSLMQVKQKKEKELKKQGKYVAPKGSAALSKADQKIRKMELQQERKKGYLVRKYMNDLRDDDEAREKGVGNDISQKIKRKFKQKTDFEQQMFTRVPETKKERFWKKSMMRKAQKSSQLRDDLKEIQMIGQIFKEQKRQDLQKIVNGSKKEKTQKDKFKGQNGNKRVKRQ